MQGKNLFNKAVIGEHLALGMRLWGDNQSAFSLGNSVGNAAGTSMENSAGKFREMLWEIL